MSLHDVDGSLGQAYGSADLIEAVRAAGVQPRDPRVKATWDLLRSRGLLSRELWVRRLLRRMWQQGLPPGNRPRTAARLDAAMRSWGLLTPDMPGATAYPGAPVYPGATVYPGPSVYPVATPYYPRTNYYPRRDHRPVTPWRPPRWPAPRPPGWVPPRYYRPPAWRR